MKFGSGIDFSLSPGKGKNGLFPESLMILCHVPHGNRGVSVCSLVAPLVLVLATSLCTASKLRRKDPALESGEDSNSSKLGMSEKDLE